VSYHWLRSVALRCQHSVCVGTWRYHDTRVTVEPPLHTPAVPQDRPLSLYGAPSPTDQGVRCVRMATHGQPHSVGTHVAWHCG